uniref:Uncharacterized protein n=1 Tax=viral metagenome TaxID=1070528 RepID=A0A6C0LF92_9ZZZZ
MNKKSRKSIRLFKNGQKKCPKMKSRIYFWKKKHAKYAQEHNGNKKYFW